MLIRKEVRIVGIPYNIPATVADPHKYVEDIAAKREQCTISYDRTYKDDPTCQKGTIGRKKIGAVAYEDKKYVKPLLDMSPTHTYKADFMELYWDEEMNPVLRYRVCVDLCDVKKELPGEYWKDWHYHGLVRVAVEEWDNLEYMIAMLRASLTGGVTEDMMETDDMIRDIARMCKQDICMETTSAIEELCFMLEMNRDAESDRLKKRLQSASMSRRSKKHRIEFAEKWWPSFCTGKASVSLLNTFCMRLKAKYNIMDNDNCLEYLKKEYVIIENDLQALPYNLYDHIEQPAMLFFVAFYKLIPREKMVDMYSAMLMRHWMQQILASKVDMLGSLMLPGSIKVDTMQVFGTFNNIHDNKIYK